jgi:ATP-binding cassette, subfamily G (WHITE), member 2, PDR
MPHFVTQRALYEVRERPSKTYSWQVFILSNILVEIPWNSLMAVLVFVSWYYPIGLRQNAVEADQVAERGALMFLFTLTFMIFAGTFTHMAVAGVETAEGAATIINLLFSLSLIFCGYVKSAPPHPSLLFASSRYPPQTQPSLSTGQY